MRILLLIGDGMADRPLKELDSKTPLEAASVPNMDRAASDGVCGLMDPISPGVRPGSDTAHLSILGYDPFVHYTGRGPFEAVGGGVKLGAGDVAFRCNFATVDDQLTVVDRRAGRAAEGLDELAAALDGMVLASAPDVKLEFKRTVGHRAVLVFHAEGMSYKISDADPGRVGAKLPPATPLQLSPEAQKTAEAVNEFVERALAILRGNPANRRRVEEGLPPANAVLVRGAGVLPSMETLKERYGLAPAACIAEVALVKGVAATLGMKVVEVAGSTAGIDSDLEAIGRRGLELLRENEFVFVNVKGPDVASHDGDVEAKLRAIERFDAVVGKILDGLDVESTVLALTSDHSTPVQVKDHTGDPVPLVVLGPGVRSDDVAEFGERAVAKGGIGRIRGMELMPLLLDLAGKAKKFGA